MELAHLADNVGCEVKPSRVTAQDVVIDDECKQARCRAESDKVARSNTKRVTDERDSRVVDDLADERGVLDEGGVGSVLRNRRDRPANAVRDEEILVENDGEERGRAEDEERVVLVAEPAGRTCQSMKRGTAISALTKSSTCPFRG